MDKKQNRYKDMERKMCLVLLADLLLFVGYLIAAGNGIIWLKVILFILTIFVAILCLVFLYLSDELFKPRSLWMSAAALAIAVCVLFSLILNFPSPSPFRDTDSTTSSTQEK